VFDHDDKWQRFKTQFNLLDWCDHNRASKTALALMKLSKRIPNDVLNSLCARLLQIFVDDSVSRAEPAGYSDSGPPFPGIHLSRDLENEPQDVVDYTVALLFLSVHDRRYGLEGDSRADAITVMREGTLRDWGYVKPGTTPQV
jgi:hypothetical protein